MKTKELLQTRKIVVVLTLIIISLFVFTQCTNSPQPLNISDNTGKKFAGSEKCMQCHKEEYDGFIHTPHNITSQIPSSENIKGSFAKGKNIFTYSYYDWLLMLNTDTGFYQAYIHNGQQVERHRMDMIIGSGERGQSFLSWENDRMIQLPASYFTSVDEWVNSPGYHQFTPDFSRVINTRCLECHVSFVKDTSTNEHIAKPVHGEVIYGVQCERCHGPAEEHVLYHEANPGTTKPMYIAHLSGLTRTQKIDMCTYCHGGLRSGDKAAFNYVAGDTIIRNKQVATINPDDFDVHGDLYAMLAESKCFKSSETLQCTTCHNVHINQRGDRQVLSNHCMSCHSEAAGNFCTTHSLPLNVLKTNCIDCHMPVKPSKMLTVTVEGKSAATTPAVIRSHYISVYPKATEDYLLKLKSSN